ncbi:DUF4352 domain-containing protein [Halovivax limisalsi]|uniref:DUF4352 domain-containing protein n=1 Tax=Halovivax limisalsi TaxID=1453760 RepID=UPI001FFDAF34|nr:DUF4352 domain-containing protein [Halovivax limisalsi]
MDRRQYLGVSSAVVAGILGGCSTGGGSDDSTDGDGTDGGADESDDGADSGGEGRPDLGDEPLEMDEAVVFYTEDGSEELAFWLGEPEFTPALVTDRREQGIISSDHPDGAFFLTVEVGLENTGDGAVDMPSGVDLTVDGQTYSHVRTALADEYDPFAEIQPGETVTQTLVFDVPDVSETGRLAVEWGRLDTATAEWAIDLGSVERRSLGLDAIEPTERVTVGTDAVQYTLSVEDVAERTDEDDKQSVHVTLRAANTGQVVAQDPTLRGVRLHADGESYEPVAYDGDDAYAVEELAPGDVATGILAFQVPATAEDYRFRIQLTMELAATWEL